MFHLTTWQRPVTGFGRHGNPGHEVVDVCRVGYYSQMCQQIGREDFRHGTHSSRAGCCLKGCCAFGTGGAGPERNLGDVLSKLGVLGLRRGERFWS